MKNEVSFLELKHLAEELNHYLADARIQKVYQPSKQVILLATRKPGQDQKFLRIRIPKNLAITKYKEEMPQRISGFCGLLRKNIEGRIISGIAQIGSERIVCITLKGKDEALIIYIELFGKGNFVLCEEDNTIIGSLEHTVFKDRVVKPGVIYEVPEREVILDQLSQDQFFQIISDSDKENVSKILAVDFSMGGVLAKEICLLSGVDSSAEDISVEDGKKLYVAWQNLLKRKAEPFLVIRDGKPFEVIPFRMRTFEKDELVALKSLSEGADKLFEVEFLTNIPKQAPPSTKAKRLQRAILIQSRKADELEKSAVEDQKIGEFIYEHYQEVKQVVDKVSSMMEEESLQEIQEKIKGGGIIKELDPEKGTVTIELE